ncbi:MAG: hypothetical protein V4714_04760 [Bacteroidota bacterium]
MAKGKKKKKRSSFFKAIKPFISDDRVLQFLFQAVAVGITWAGAMKAQKNAEVVGEIADNTQALLQSKPDKAKSK